MHEHSAESLNLAIFQKLLGARKKPDLIFTVTYWHGSTLCGLSTKSIAD